MLPIYELNKTFIIEDYKILNRINGFGGYQNNKFVGIEYFKIEYDNQFYADIIPKECQHNFETTLMTVNIDVPPHMDISRDVTINLYLKASQAQLKFYQFKDDNDIIKIPTPENKSVFPREYLIETTSLCVEENHAYLMNVKMPHSVDNHITGENRIAICTQTSFYTFEQVYNMLISTGNL